MEICLNWIPRRALAPPSLRGVGRPRDPRLAAPAGERNSSPYLQRGLLGEREGTLGGGGRGWQTVFRLSCGWVQEYQELTLPRNLSAPTQQGHTVGPFDVLTA